MWEYLYYKIHEISSLTDSEYAAFVINYHNSGKQDESKALKDRGYTKEQIAHVLGKKKINRLRSLDLEFDDDNLVKYPWLSFSIITHQGFQQGILPYPGSLSEQPAKIIEIFSLLDQLKYEAEEQTRKRVEREQKQRGRR